MCDSPGEATEADGPRTTVPVDKDANVDAGLSAGDSGTHDGSEAATTAETRRAGVGSDTVGSAENTESNGGVPTVGSRATINDGANRADSISQYGENSGTSGGITANTPGGEQARDKETPCQSASQLSNDAGKAARCGSCGESEIGAGVPTTRVPDEDAYTLTRRDGAGTTGLGHASAASVHGDAVAAPGGEKAGMFNDKQTQREKSFADEGGIGAELGFIGARPHECHAGDLFNADAGATANGERCDEGSYARGVPGSTGHAGAGNVWEHSPAPAPTPAPGTHGGGNRGCGASKEDAAIIGLAGAAGSGGHEGGGSTSGNAPVGVSYGVPDGGFSPIVYVDYGHQEQDWFEVYGPDYTDDEGELLPDVAAAARHSIPAGGGVVPVSPGSFLQVVDVVKWWLGADGTMSADALGTLRRFMKGSSR